MTQWRLQSTPGLISVDGADRYVGFFGVNVTGPTEAEITLKAYTAFTFSDLRCDVSRIDSGSGNLTFRDDGVDSTNIDVSITGVGWFEDITGSDTVAANSLVNAVGQNLGMHGDTTHIDNVMVTYEHASTDAPIAGIGVSTSISTTTYLPVSNGPQIATEAQAETRVKRAKSASNLRARVSAITGTWSLTCQHDTVASSNIVISSITGTGEHEDVTGSETFAAEDDVDFGVIEDASGQITVEIMQMDFDVPEDMWGTQSAAFTTREYQPWTTVGGTTSTDDNWLARIGSTTAANIQTYVTDAGSGTRDYTLRVGTTDSTNVTISITGTGLFEDVTGSEAVADGDSVTVSMASTGTSVTVQRGGLELPWSAVGGAVDQEVLHRPKLAESLLVHGSVH